MKRFINSHFHRQLTISVVLLVIAVLSATSGLDRLVASTGLRGIDEQAEHYLNQALKQALATFTVVRGINGVISVLQNTGIAVSPAGVGVDLALGEVLDPVNDLVERFSWVMLCSLTAIGAQRVLMEIGQWMGVRVLLTAALLVLLAGLWLPSRFSFIRAAGYRLLIISLVVRFSMPLVCLSSDFVYDAFLRETHDQAAGALDIMGEEIKSVVPVSAGTDGQEPPAGVIERVKKVYDDAMDLVNLGTRVESLKDTMADFVEYTVDLILVFLLQTVVVPLTTVWLMVKLLGGVFRLIS